MTQGPGMKMPGEMLAAARLAAELSVAQVAEKTKIPPASLQAIEQDEYHKISGDLYVKSFLRLYAEAVALDPEDVLAAYRRLVGEVSLAADGTEAPAWSVEEVQVKGIGLPWHRILPVVAVVLALILALVFFRGCGEDPAPEKFVTPVSVPDASPPDSLGVMANTPVAPVETNTEPTVQESASPGSSPAAGPGIDQAANPASMLAPAPAGVPDLEFRNGKRFPLVLRIICDGPQDLRVQVDGAGAHLPAFWPPAGVQPPSLADGRPEPGRVYSAREGLVVYWGGEDHFSLIFERLSGVAVTTNGESRDMGQVRPGQECILDVHPPGYFVRP